MSRTRIPYDPKNTKVFVDGVRFAFGWDGYSSSFSEEKTEMIIPASDTLTMDNIFSRIVVGETITVTIEIEGCKSVNLYYTSMEWEILPTTLEEVPFFKYTFARRMTND